MNFAGWQGDHFTFEIGRREKRLLLEVLKLYPLVPSSHHRLTMSGDAAEAAPAQKLLNEALAEQKHENKKQLELMLNEGGRFTESDSGYRFILSQHQLEWLLQVLNDIRVGSWLILGEPDEKKGKRSVVKLESAVYLWAMELSGYFQSVLLEASGQREGG